MRVKRGTGRGGKTNIEMETLPRAMRKVIDFFFFTSWNDFRYIGQKRSVRSFVLLRPRQLPHSCATSPLLLFFSLAVINNNNNNSNGGEKTRDFSDPEAGSKALINVTTEVSSAKSSQCILDSSINCSHQRKKRVSHESAELVFIVNQLASLMIIRVPSISVTYTFWRKPRFALALFKKKNQENWCQLLWRNSMVNDHHRRLN